MASKFTINKEWRECSQCNIFKIWDCFDKNKSWYRSACKLCRSSTNSSYRDSTGKKNRSVIKHKEERWLKTDKWEYAKPTDYELEWQKEAIDMNRPHQSIYSKIWVDLSVKKV